MKVGGAKARAGAVDGFFTPESGALTDSTRTQIVACRRIGINLADARERTHRWRDAMTAVKVFDAAVKRSQGVSNPCLRCAIL